MKTAVRGLGTARSLPAWIFSAALASSVVIGSHIVLHEWIAAGVDQTYMTPLSGVDILWVLLATPLLTMVVMLLADLLEEWHAKERDPGPARQDRSGMRFIGVALALLVAWMPYILTYAPGSVQPDSLFSLAGQRTNHHPIVYTLVVSTFARTGEALGNINYGVFAYTLAQCLVMALVLSFAVLRVTRNGAPSWWLVATTAYFALVPVFPIYAINMQKDTLFSLFVMLLSLALFEIARGRGAVLRTTRGVATFLALCTLVVFFRNNGIFIAIGSTLALALFYRRGFKALYLAAAVLLLAIILVQGPGYTALGVTRNTFVESIGIPLQQVAYVVATDGDVTPEQQQFLDPLLPYAEWQRAYAPCIVDPLKWNPQFDGAYLNANRIQFFETWGSLLRQNPGAYVRAYFLATVGFWKIGVSNSYGFADTSVIDNPMGVRPTDLFAELTGISIKPLLDATRGKDGAGGFVGVAILIWTTLLIGTLLVMAKRPEFTLALAPCVTLWLTVMIATPVAFSLRYVFALALCMPGFLLLPFARPAADPAASDQEATAS